MSRVIKFRVMDINGKWHYYTLGDFVCQTPIPAHIRPETWTQFTGLLDANGVEIYEGDIVDCHLQSKHGTHGDYRGRVIYSEFAYCVETNQLEWPIASFRCSKSIKVIGNIYKHSELLS